MDFIDRLREISARIPKLKEGDVIKTEEGTKNALVMPFINALGYNVFDPTEVTPELNADFGTKKGEKVDYAILRDGKPVMLFECKSLGTNLQTIHASQLYRYFSVTSSRFGVLTDGVEYRFFSDLVEQNKMDSDPFFIFNLADLKDSEVEELRKFAKGTFDESSILTAASELKYRNLIRIYLTEQLQNPSEALVRTLMKESKAYTGTFFQSAVDNFRPVVREALRSFIAEQLDNRIKSAFAVDAANQKAAAPEPIPAAPEPSPIKTTEEETYAFLIIKAILRQTVDVKRVTMRDAQSYCAILLDDNNRRPIARLYFGPKSKSVGIFDAHKVEQRQPISSLDDLYLYADTLRESLARYLIEAKSAG
jgi:hypothetical protein